MSRLSDLLNPVPAASPLQDAESAVSEDVQITPKASKSHHRNQSITSPLEALAIAATTSFTEPGLTNTASPLSFSSPPIQQQQTLQNSHRPIFGSPYVPPTNNSPPQQISFSLYNQPSAPSELSRSNVNGVGNKNFTPPSLHDHEGTDISHTQNSIAYGQAADTSIGKGTVSIALGIQPISEENKTQNSVLLRDEQASSGVEKQPPEPEKESKEMALKAIKREESQTPSLAAKSPAAAASPSATPTAKATKPAPKQKTDKKENANPSKKKSAPRKRKIEAESRGDTPLSQRSGTPNSNFANRTVSSKNAKQSSATPAQSSPPADDGEEEDEESDNELFCICRKPDDHTWMIGCDGGCEDWFHGHCINMNQKDESLIDKYICPNCSAKKGIQTTWKPMCRLEGCRNPARAAGPNPSKYCCDEHGIQFMRDAVMNRTQKESDAPAKKRRKENYTDHIGNEDEQEPPHLRGGYLLPREIKRLVGGVNKIGEFKRLGHDVPVFTAAFPLGTDGAGDAQPSPAFSSQEEEQLTSISSKRKRVSNLLEALDDKEHLLGMVKTRALGVLNELKKKEKNAKDICGFDRRLRWSQDEFDRWRASPLGREALKARVLPPPAADETDADGDAKMTDGASDGSEEIGRGVCQKKRCKQHDGWYKLHLQELAFDRSDCRRIMQELDVEEKGLRERAMIRSLEATS